jgi:diaminohydroxyphosphoribosylaminopyrimidine deaminase/5-amino-6-(5-phosphoribosylamino)uracil reductase
VEGGGRLAASLLRAGLVDAIEWFRAPILIGGDGVPCIAALGLERLDDAGRWRTAALESVGEDVRQRLERG